MGLGAVDVTATAGVPDTWPVLRRAIRGEEPRVEFTNEPLEVTDEDGKIADCGRGLAV